jgi:hypothetical protein
MNFLLLIARYCFVAAVSCLIAIFSSVIITIILAKIVDILELNYKSNTYWVLNISLATLVLVWITTFIYLTGLIR